MKELKAIFFYLCIFAHFFSFGQKAKFVASTPGTEIKIIRRENVEDYVQPTINAGPVAFGSRFQSETVQNYGGKTDTSFVGIDSGYYKCKTEYSLMLLERKGYKSKTELVYTSGLNVNKKRFVLKTIAPLNKRKKEQSFIHVEKVSLNVNSKKFKQKYYDSYNDYLKNNEEHQYTSEREIIVKNSVFEESLENYLRRTGYTDTSSSLSFLGASQIDLTVVVNAITEHKFGRFCVVELLCTVKLEQSSVLIKEKEYTTYSNIGFDNSFENEAKNRQLVAEAINATLEKIQEDPDLQDVLLAGKGIKKAPGWEDSIVINNKLLLPVNLENSTKSVVTILQKNWHGSGCLISSDGYLVTNFHVVGADTSEVYALFNSGVKKRCRFVRGNAEFDLSLLKMDSANINPIKVNVSKTISVGADAYAIGTPKDINLGQSITKGIISGKRNLSGRIFIQSDVSVNKGNSGGAFTNKEGELIGIVVAKLSGFGIEGVGFAIPAFYLEEALRLRIKSD